MASDPVTFILLLLFAQGTAPARAERYIVHLRARGKNERASLRFIAGIERMGRVVEMRNYDGQNIDLTWEPPPEAFTHLGPGGEELYREHLRELEAAGGVTIRSVREVSR